MPQYPVVVYDADGQPMVMHSIDAKEAVQLGDYTYAPPGEADPQAMAAARARFETGQSATHPELLTDEAKDKQRREANEKAALLATIPEGAQVVVMAPESTQSREAPRRPSQSSASGQTARSTATATGTAPSPSASTPTPSSTSEEGEAHGRRPRG